jgi:hypothetical protein
MRRLLATSIAIVVLSLVLLTIGGPLPRVLPAGQLQAEDSITFGVIGDYGECSAAEQNVATMVDGWTPDFIVTAGDNWQGGNMDGGGACDTYAEAVGAYYGTYVTGQDLLPSPGNHDYYADNPDGLNHYRSYFTYIPTDDDFGQRYYDFVQGDVHFFMMDSDEALRNSTFMQTQRDWLQSRLGASSTTWQIVIFHHPPYTSGAAHADSTAMRWPFAAWGADLVIGGHNHTYERIARDGIRYFTVGSGGGGLQGFGTIDPYSEVRYGANYGAMRVTASDVSITLEFLSIDGGGTVQDAYTLNLAPTPTPTPVGLFGDVDADCDVDIVDIMLVANRWGASVGDPAYNARYDLDGNGTIDSVDVMLVAARWNSYC